LGATTEGNESLDVVKRGRGGGGRRKWSTENRAGARGGVDAAR